MECERPREPNFADAFSSQKITDGLHFSAINSAQLQTLIS